MDVSTIITSILCIVAFYYFMIRPLIKERKKYVSRQKKGALYGR